MTRKMIVHTFKGSGETVVVPPVSFYSLLKKVKKEMPEPKPPSIKVEYGNGITDYEPNYNDPDYPARYKKWDEDVKVRCSELALNRIALKQRLSKEQKEAVAELRRDLEGEEDLHPNDKIVWFFDIALVDSEIETLIKKAQGQADPTPEVIAEKANGFQGDVSGQRRVSMPSST